jgi:hypothetical protein
MKVKNKKIIILIVIIIIAPILIWLSIFNGNISGETRNTMGIIGFALYIVAIIYSLLIIRSKKNK